MAVRADPGVERKPNAVELTVDQAWYIAETAGAGTFPWVLAITVPYTDARERGAFLQRQRDELVELGVASADGTVNPAVVDWVRLVCFPQRWLDLRYIGPARNGSRGPEGAHREGAPPGGGQASMLRGIVAQRGRRDTVVALRSAQLVTFTAMDIDDPRALVPVLGVGLQQRPPARFDEFSLPMRVGARADQRLRDGAPLAEVLDYLAIPESARPVVEAVFTDSRSYVEIVAGCDSNGRHTTTEVGMSIVDTDAGRVLVTPSRAFDGEWVSTFKPGTDLAVALAVEQLTDCLAEGQWYPDRRLTRDFTAQST